MEKKTIGKFIAVLRKANGMTQRELGERLFVSDKTISRWECDECTPELSLIPVIAEIFGVTTDELLRGERAAQGRENCDWEKSNTGSQKGDKQFRFMLYNRLKKYQNLTLISFGLAILGLVAAMVANLAFSEGLIGFCLSAVCAVAAGICQMFFAANANLLVDEEDGHAESIREANSSITRRAVTVFFALVALLSFCLPIVALTNGGVNYGLGFSSWLLYGILFVAVALSGAYIIYKLWIVNLLLEKQYIYFSAAEQSKHIESRLYLKRLLRVAFLILIFLLVLLFVFNVLGPGLYIEKKVFYMPEELKAYMEADYDRWFEEGYTYSGGFGEVITILPIPGNQYESEKQTETVLDENGNALCTFYYNPDLYARITFTNSNQMPVTVVTKEAYHNGWDTYYTILSIITMLCAADILVCAGVYMAKHYKIYKEQ